MLKVAQAGLKYETVSYLGGIRVTLDHMDEALVVQGMLAELVQIRDKRANLEEREAIMFESASPAIRDLITRLDEQRAQIRTLTAACNTAMREDAELKAERRKLRHQRRSLEAALERGT